MALLLRLGVQRSAYQSFTNLKKVGNMSMMETKAKIDQIASELERLIDAEGLDIVLAAIREICYDKAQHIAVDYQDLALAKQWLAYGIKVNSAAQGVR
jgi:CRISPR/Cas system-associated endoribonuclease Cas2